MAAQLLIYERAVPVSQQRHHNWSVKVNTDCAFARHINSVPLLASEFQAAAHEYVIVFAGTEKDIMPSVILGMRDRENLYLSDTGEWNAQYSPAFIRRYPFVFATDNEGETFTMYIDEEHTGCNQEGIGERLFDDAGKQTPYLDNVLEFLKAYQVQFQQTQVFCNRLRELDIIEPMQVEFAPETGDKVSLSGFMVINRDKLKELSGDKLAELARTDELELMYLHLQSMRNISQIANRMSV
uniref:SapC protein n=1 Tax=Candidatus Kentrum sp. FW TaxID=2126338 RepID=A0A450SV86_9GAMM|nr:MAG: SapC protein [Candidatus Kentron sp. FW]VFJ57904.1 MAG: SapC protein [Candidatus Kentron sp. FW]